MAKKKPTPLPCPCGRAAVLTKIRPGRWSCGCVKDFCIVYEDTEVEAIEHWNGEVAGHDTTGKGH